MFERLIGNKIHVVNSFYGDIKPRVTSVELISLSDTKCKFKIYATLENINEYFIKVTKDNKKIFGNTESEETEDYVLKLRRDYFFKSIKYLINLNKRSLKDIKLESIINISKEQDSIIVYHNEDFKYDENDFESYNIGLNENGFYGISSIKKMFSLWYSKTNHGDAIITASNNTSIHDLIEIYIDKLLSIYNPNRRNIVVRSYYDISEKDKYVDSNIELLEYSLNEGISFSNNKGYKCFEHSLNQLKKIKSNFVLHKIYMCIYNRINK